MDERAFNIVLGLIAGMFFFWSATDYEKKHDYLDLLFMPVFLFAMMYAAARLAML